MSKLSKELKVSSSPSTARGRDYSKRDGVILMSGRGQRGACDQRNQVMWMLLASGFGLESSPSNYSIVSELIRQVVECLLHDASQQRMKRRSILVSVRSQGSIGVIDMEKLERVQRMTYRRMSQVDSELERFEERPELDTRRRYGLLLRRFEELERLYHILRRDRAPNPRQLVERIFAEHAQSLLGEAESLRGELVIELQESTTDEAGV